MAQNTQGEHYLPRRCSHTPQGCEPSSGPSKPSLFICVSIERAHQWIFPSCFNVSSSVEKLWWVESWLQTPWSPSCRENVHLYECMCTYTTSICAYGLRAIWLSKGDGANPSYLQMRNISTDQKSSKLTGISVAELVGTRFSEARSSPSSQFLIQTFQPSSMTNCSDKYKYKFSNLLTDFVSRLHHSEVMANRIHQNISYKHRDFL